jgi:hypothetical protein
VNITSKMVNIKVSNQIKKETKCQKNFRCLEKGYSNICKVKEVSNKEVLECLEPEDEHCDFRIPFGYSFFCNCPIRKKIHKILNE